MELYEFISADWWVTRNNCGWFPSWLVFIYVAANLMIFASYASIPHTLHQLGKRGYRLFGDGGTTIRFCWFIALCGTGHLIENVMVWWWPHYLIFAVWHVLTAFVSVRAAFELTQLRQVVVTKVERDQMIAMRDGVLHLDDTAKTFTDEIESLKKIAARLTQMPKE